ncbi:unnamed protein product [Cochlearia groenlandica]
MSSSSSDSSSSGSSSVSSGDSLSPEHLRRLEALERGSPSAEMSRENSRLLPRPDSARDRSSEQVTSGPGGFVIDPMARTPPRERIEVPHLIDEEITPPPLVRRDNAEGTRTSPKAGAKRPKRPRRINSFASSTSRFDDGLGSIQDISGAGEPLEIIEPEAESWSLDAQDNLEDSYDEFDQEDERKKGFEMMNSRSLPSLFGEPVPDPPADPEAVLLSETRATRARDVLGDSQANPRVKRVRTGGSIAPVGDRSEVREVISSEDPVVAASGPNVASEVGAQTEGRPVGEVGGTGGADQAIPAVTNEVVAGVGSTDPVIPQEGDNDVFTSSSLPLFKGVDFAFRLGKDKPYGFEFVYEGDSPFLNNGEACAGFKHMLFESHEEKCPPSSLVFEDEIAALARLEQRVAYKRMKLSYDYENLLVVERSRAELAEDAKSLVEKERDEARAEVVELKKKLRHAKREKTVKTLREQLAKSEADNVRLKADLEAVTSSSEAKRSELELLQKTADEVSSELGAYKARYSELIAYNNQEVGRLRSSRLEYVEAAREQFAKFREASEARLGRLRDFLTEEEFVRDNFLLWNQLKGIFDTLAMIQDRYQLVPPSDFVDTLRARKEKLKSWLDERPTVTYSASDFELPGNLGIDSVPELSVYDEDDEQLEDEAQGANERLEDEAQGANERIAAGTDQTGADGQSSGQN